MLFSKEDLENAFEAGRERERDTGDSFDDWFYENFVSTLPMPKVPSLRPSGFITLADMFLKIGIYGMDNQKKNDKTFRWEEKGMFNGGDVKWTDLDEVK